MTSLLLLAQDFFERATNPAYGVAVNDEYAARLAAATGPEDVGRFIDEVARLDDPSTLTSYGWAWVIEFAIGHDVVLDLDLLADLCLRWDEAALVALVIEAALTNRPDGNSAGRAEIDAWLDSVIERATPRQTPPDRRADNADRGVDTGVADQYAASDISAAEVLLTALLVVDTPQTLNAARRLLDRRWNGSDPLAAFVAARADDPDPLGRTRWVAFRG